MLVSKFFNENLQISPFVLGAFFGRFVVQNDYIYTLSTYRSSEKIDDKIFYKQSKENYLNALNSQSNGDFWEINHYKTIKRAEFVCVLQNDLNLNNDEFYAKLLRKIFLSDFFLDSDLSEAKKKFIRGFFELRGSIDTTRPLLTQDYFYKNSAEIKRIHFLVDNFFVSENELNWNFRELQNQFVSGENKRNTQLRINLFWYLKNIGLINEYKAKIASEIYDLTPNLIGEIYYFDCGVQTHGKAKFTERVNFYLNSVFGKKLSEFEIKKLRKDLEFNENFGENEFWRDANIIKFMRFNTPDECFACKKIYNIKDRSFPSKPLNGRYYTEIHHVISVGKDKDLDVLENLAKLCPVCHRALKKGASDEKVQKDLICEILNSNPQNLEFAKIIFQNENLDILTDKIWQNLK
ncbi:HNH endonuclease signature motif containing protein [Campylobacter sp. CN_NA2]|uniref:HNH endonuclease signature motif containing protein n=1 Tax=Campylobacter sp. CN_NA2 TaxID=2984145 RepID=UPI0022E9D5A9|nr:HNH endonuclease signature motif containing protein [Campylobacter sp. CN_NA2]MDA3087769.1 HNH endonuclease [Campylobacter sp. CN_NA2]